MAVYKTVNTGQKQRQGKGSALALRSSVTNSDVCYSMIGHAAMPMHLDNRMTV